MVETTVGKIIDEVKADLHARKENWNDTFRGLKERVSLKEVGNPILISEDTVLGKHFKKAREITAKTIGRK